jgi:pilus assembly protein CpaF
MIIIRVEPPKGPPSEITCVSTQFSAGSGPDNLVQLFGGKVAMVHFRGMAENGQIFIEDAGSIHGTFVNGERIRRSGPVTAADQIQAGDYRIYLSNGKDRAEAQGAVSAPAAPAALPTASPVPLSMATAAVSEAQGKKEELRHWQNRVHQALLLQMDLKRVDVSRMSEDVLRSLTSEMINGIIARLDDLPSGLDRSDLARAVLNETVGLGPLEGLLADDSISEIMVNRYDEIYVECHGRLELSSVAFTSDAAVMSVIERIVSPLGRRIDESSPMVDARLPDGSRVNAVIPPLALRGPCITIRKFFRHRLEIDDLVRYGTISAEMVSFLRVAVEQRRNIVVSGGTGSGKTTFLNVLSNFIPHNERLVSVEDAAELQLSQPNLISLEARPANAEGKGQVAIRDLVKNCLRMRPDRIVVGECRGGEALDMLQAMNTGHDGSLTTVHANTPRDALSRIEVMVLMAGVDMPLAAIREQVASGVQLIVQQARFSCGSRKVTHISEVTGTESGKIQLQDLFLFRQHGYGPDGKVQGEFVATGAIPEFYEALSQRGIATDLSIFRAGGQAT